MKKMKYAVAACVLAMSFGTSANAATESTNSSALGKSFSSAWSKTVINTSTKTFKVGYNTSWINEDYTHTYHSGNSHTAYVKNTGSAQTLKGSAGSYAKAEIQHHSGTVYYSYTY
ncbi:hypothetical protein AWM68_13205 [Fictibacillus phosphorivorans]|uniref:Lactococcin 972 family bacteriocin n=1 Tax=Fictibacillus phosphorivorans TaxID=1221500 RepID=A0A161RRV7_9BACL|nr:hypothetical protein [Fictibacillus phosphorivorans]KZE64059.1 hypothetical protein AWM68_13205 [Fictibacillus phosphorivorans]